MSEALQVLVAIAKVLWKILATVVLVFGTIALCGILLIAWVWGTRFSPEAALEAVSGSYGVHEPIEGETCCFYYLTVDDVYDVENEDWDMCDAILRVMPVQKSSSFTWYATPDPDSRSVYAYVEGAKIYVGRFQSYESRGVYHNFFIPDVYPPDFDAQPHVFAMPDVLGDGYTVVTVNGEDMELFRHSYFTTDSPVEAFIVNGVELMVSP